MKRELKIILGVLFVGILLYALLRGAVLHNGEKPFEITGTPTNFAEYGTVVFNNPGLKANTPYFVYEEPGSPALTKELIIDAESACVANNGSVPCLAMSVTFDMPFGGRRVLVEGIEEGDGIRVKKLQRIEDGEWEFDPETGKVYIPWPIARREIENCNITQIVQTHSLEVYLTAQDGSEIVTVEPVIDEVFSVWQSAREKCGDITVATE